MSTASLSPTAVLRALQEETAKLAAPTAGAPTPPHGPEGGLAGDVQGSWGWSFLFGMGFLLVVYCIVGCCRGTSHGRSGAAAMPHADFWRSLPQLVGDGVRFAMGEDIPDARERRQRSVAGIEGHDDEYYPADRQSAEYEPIAGGSRRTPGDYGGRGRSQNAANRADRRPSFTYEGPDEEDRRPPPPPPAGVGGGDDDDDDEWRNRKTRDTRREEREERERRVKAWVDSGGADAHWMLSLDDREAASAVGSRDDRRLSMDE